MPDCDVDVKFIVNEDGTNPEEDDLENNVASATIELVETFNNLEIINLPYDALSRIFLLSLQERMKLKHNSDYQEVVGMETPKVN